MKHTFTAKSFSQMKFFTPEVQKLLGENSHAETSYATAVIEYSKEFAAMIRPYPPAQIFDFELVHFQCVDCKKAILMIAPVGREYTVCEPCEAKRKAADEKKAKKAVVAVTTQ